MQKVISNEFLVKKYLDQSIIDYFQKKMPNEQNEILMLKLVELLKYFLLSECFKGDIPFSEELDEVWPCCTNRELNKLSLFPNLSLCSAHGDWSANF